VFDVGNPSSLVPTQDDLTIAADLLASPELAQVLIDAGLTSSNVSGADVGDVLVEAIVPEPLTAGLLAMGTLALLRRRRH